MKPNDPCPKCLDGKMRQIRNPTETSLHPKALLKCYKCGYIELV